MYRRKLQSKAAVKEVVFPVDLKALGYVIMISAALSSAPPNPRFYHDYNNHHYIRGEY